jgi:hypothetical protein
MEGIHSPEQVRRKAFRLACEPGALQGERLSVALNKVQESISMEAIGIVLLLRSFFESFEGFA